MPQTATIRCPDTGFTVNPTFTVRGTIEGAFERGGYVVLVFVSSSGRRTCHQRPITPVNHEWSATITVPDEFEGGILYAYYFPGEADNAQPDSSIFCEKTQAFKGNVFQVGGLRVDTTAGDPCA